LLARALDGAKAGDRILVVCEADGADALVFEATPAIKDMPPVRAVDRWIASKRNDLAYNTYLKWRGVLPFEPPRRPDPERPAAPPRRVATSAGSSLSSARGARSARRPTSRRSACASSAAPSIRCVTSASPTPRAASPPTRWIISRIPCSPRWWLHSSTTRVAA